MVGGFCRFGLSHSGFLHISVRSQAVIPTSFVDVGHAAAIWQLRETDPLGQLEYPSITTWKRYEAASSIVSDVARLVAEQPTTILFGLPRTGKTFHALLFGIDWSSIISHETAHTPVRFANYGIATSLSIGDVLRQWSDPLLRVAECLWIVDDIHDNIERTVDLVELFHDTGLGDAGHRLLLIGWTVPNALRRFPNLEIVLRQDAVRAVLRRCGRDYISDEALAPILGARTIALTAVRWAASSEATVRLLSMPELLEPAWLDRRYQNLTKSERDTCLDLARLRFLSVPIPVQSVSLHVTLRPLLDKGILTRVGDNLVRMTHEDEARSLLRNTAGGEIPADFVRSVIRLALNEVTLALPITLGLSQRSVSQLNVWLGIDTDETPSEPLLELARGLISEHLPTIVQSRTVPATSGIRLLRLYNDQDAIPTLRSLLSSRHDELLHEAREPLSWLRIFVAVQEARDESLDNELRAALRRDDFVHRLQLMPGPVWGQLLRSVRKFDAGAWRDLYNAMIRQLPAWAPVRIWRRLQRLLRAEPEFTADIIRSNSDAVRQAVFNAPHECTYFLRDHVPRRPAVAAAIIQAIREAVERVPLDAAVVPVWPRDTQLPAYCDAARLLDSAPMVQAIASRLPDVTATGRGNILIDIAHTFGAWRTAPKGIVDNIRAALADRAVNEPEESGILFAAMILDRERAKGVAKQVLQQYVENAGEYTPQLLFWVFWHGLVAGLRSDDTRIVVLASQVSERWFELCGDVFSLPLAGVVRRVTGRKLKMNEAVSSDRMLRSICRSPAVLIFYLYALVDLADDWDPAMRAGELEEIFQHLRINPRDLRHRWRDHQVPRTRRLLLDVVAAAIQRALKQPLHRLMAYEFGTTAGTHDMFWDENMFARLKVLAACGNAAAICGIAARRTTRLMNVLGGKFLGVEDAFRYLLIISTAHASVGGSVPDEPSAMFVDNYPSAAAESAAAALKTLLSAKRFEAGKMTGRDPRALSRVVVLIAANRATDSDLRWLRREVSSMEYETLMMASRLSSDRTGVDRDSSVADH
jgi:hypothetical protein